MSPCSAPAAWPPRDSDHLLVSGAQMAELENQLFASGLPVEALMEKAALAVTKRLLEQHGPQLRQHGALILVGPGHNGGDGLVIARELHLAGIAVRIWSAFEGHKPLTERHLRHARWLGIPQLPSPPEPGDPALWIDAILGIGQRRPAGEAVETLLAERQREQPGRLVAIDVPTGLCATTGLLTGAVAAQACRTYAIGLMKSGLVQDRALAWVGALERVEMGLAAALLQTLAPHQPLGLHPDDLRDAPWPRQSDPAAGKYQRGRLLLVAGSNAYRGAAQLAMAGARASGCGCVRAALPASCASTLWLSHPEVLLTRELACTAAGHLDLTGMQPHDLERVDAVALGPGLGRGAGPSEADRSWELLQRFSGLLVLDADGLNRLADRGAAMAWLRGRQGPTWLTPHGGEFSRLFPAHADKPPLAAAAAAAADSGATLVLKGARSVVAAADGRLWQLLQAEPRVARAGLGDVLAGYAAGLGARDLACSGSGDAAILALATLAHARAGQYCGERGDTSPGAVSEALRQVLTQSTP